MSRLPIHKNKNIIIVGDIMLDKFYYGKIEDTSKEDPLAKILCVEQSSDNLGGAGNVAMNINAMASNPFLIGVVGDDLAGKRIVELSSEASLFTQGIIIDKTRPTTIKSRLYDNDQVIRFDIEETKDIEEDSGQEIIIKVKETLKQQNIDAIILQDYNKGVLTKQTISSILELGKSFCIPIYVDPKRKNFFEYHGVTLFKPNEREINWSLPRQNFKKAARQIQTKLKTSFTVVTLAEKGMFLCSDSQELHSPTLAKHIVDVCGAGDTVISILALTHISECNMNLMAQLSNLAAAKVCQSKGVKPINYIDLEELYASLCEDKDIIDIS